VTERRGTKCDVDRQEGETEWKECREHLEKEKGKD
jgi:hypothetical protein